MLTLPAKQEKLTISPGTISLGCFFFPPPPPVSSKLLPSPAILFVVRPSWLIGRGAGIPRRNSDIVLLSVPCGEQSDCPGPRSGKMTAMPYGTSDRHAKDTGSAGPPRPRTATLTNAASKRILSRSRPKAPRPLPDQTPERCPRGLRRAPLPAACVRASRDRNRLAEVCVSARSLSRYPTGAVNCRHRPSRQVLGKHASETRTWVGLLR